MPTVFEKLNLKDQREIVVLNPPPTFEAELAGLRQVQVRRDIAGLPRIQFALAFVVSRSELDRIALLLAAKAEGDAIVWFAYPKGTSKRYACDFNRDSGWDALTAAGFDSVRMIAIDEDWSAIRFRRREYVKPSSASRIGTSKRGASPGRSKS